MPEETLLSISHIDALHGSFQALWDVSLSVGPGEIVAIIGANGAGKSTLLDAISGLVHPAKGSIEFEGRNVTHLEPYDLVSLGICLVPEAGRTFPNMTVRENLHIG